MEMSAQSFEKSSGEHPTNSYGSTLDENLGASVDSCPIISSMTSSAHCSNVVDRTDPHLDPHLDVNFNTNLHLKGQLSSPHPAAFIPILIILAGLPQLSETLYTPALPTLAKALQTSATYMEYTLTLYLVGFTLGTLFWGWLSDSVGRKPCVIAGLVFFMLGCLGCALSDSVMPFMFARSIQGFGGSIGSVLAQSMGRDTFSGEKLSQVYASISQALALFPALGPVFGSLVVSWGQWRHLFWFLFIFAMILSIAVEKNCPETHPIENRIKIPFFGVVRSLLKDKKVWACGGIVAGCNGIMFSYFAEGPFYMVEQLGLDVKYYGLSFVLIALAVFLGGWWAKKMHHYLSSASILYRGLWIITIFTGAASLIVTAHHYFTVVPPSFLILTNLMCQMGIGFGICVATSVTLAVALSDYRHCVGRASSIFGFFYYACIALITGGMGLLHNGTLLPMPWYFLLISVGMLFVSHHVFCNKNKLNSQI